MAVIRRTILERGARASLPWIAALALTIFMTWPLAAGLGSLGRTGIGSNADARFGTNGDGMFSLWNVSWVARTLIADPANLFQANIFYPHRDALAYSEANLFAGLLGVPVWWATENPYATLNVVIIFAFTSAWYCAWLLARYLTADPIAAASIATFYAFCPYVFAHTAHIQLMLTGGIPLAMLLLHKLADRPSLSGGFALGGALLVQALACAYYGIFAGLMVGFGAVFFSIGHRLYRVRLWWTSLVLAAAVAIGGVAPFLLPYFEIRGGGFARSLADSIPWSANAASYLASSAYAHRWLLRLIDNWPRWREVMFPGILPLLLATVGVGWMLVRRGGGIARERETALLYGSIGVLAFWSSFGPSAGLYTALYHTLPIFSFLRAPSRLAIVVVLCLAVLAAIGLTRLLSLAPARRRGVALLIGVASVAELATSMPWEQPLMVPGPYDYAKHLPRAPLTEFPFYGRRPAWHLHTQYMLFSTTHWLPMMNGYSDHTPPQFRQEAIVLDAFPSHEAFAVMARARVRYVGVHWDMYGERAVEIRSRLQPFRHHLRLLAASPRMSLYEIVSFP